MALQNVTDAIINELTVVTGITKWDAIQFSLLPAESPIGYVQLVNLPIAPNQSLYEARYMVMIGFAELTLSGLQDAIDNLVSLIVAGFSQPRCLALGGSGSATASINSRIVIDTPDSDVTQNNISGTTLFRNALAFNLEVKVNREALQSGVIVPPDVCQAELDQIAILEAQVASVAIGMRRMTNAFFQATIQPDISFWDTSTIIDMSGTFTFATFNTDISNWNVELVASFNQFAAFSQMNPDLANWNPVAATSWQSAFTANSVVTGLSFNNLIKASVVNLQSMFQNAINATPATSNWDTSNVVNFNSAFQNAINANPDVTNWDITAGVSFVSTFNSSAADPNLSLWNPVNATDFTNFLANSNHSTTNYDAMLIAWAALPLLQNNVTFTTSAQYSAGAAATARQSIITTYNWTFDDGGQVP